MNNKKTSDSFYKRLLPTVQSTKPDDGKRIPSNSISAYHRNSRNTTDALDRQISSHSSIGSLSSLSPARGAIDAQTYVDAQSNGLTQRIVRYDEENKKAQSLFNRAYKRPGDFPIVHLDKPKLVLTPQRNVANPPKMARIGQPDPCINRTNIRAEILRNGTMMPTVSLDRRDDGDNVRVDPLDALKEISRKRIHCEDTISSIQPTLEKDTTDSNQSPSCNNSKRQRIAPVNSPSANETGKRSSSKCNEILSSLSSSSYMLSDSLKRAKVTSPNNSISPPQAKRLQTEKSIETPINDTPAVVSVSKPVEKDVPEVAEKTYPTEPVRPKLTLFNRPYSANSSTVPRANAGRNDECNIPFVKPRPMTEQSRESVEKWLKVKPDDKRRLSLMLKCLGGEADDGRDTVDSGEKDKTENPKSVNPATGDASSKELGKDKNAPEKSVVATVATNAQNNITSSTTTSLPTKPVVTINPVSTTVTTAASLFPTTTSVQPVTTTAQPPVTTVQPPVTTQQQQVPTVQPPTSVAATTAEERKGGFSFPFATKPTSASTAPTAVVSSTPTIIASFSSPPTATVTPSVVAPSPSTLPKEPLINPTVSFTFHPAKPKETSSSPVVTTAAPSKPFSFGAAPNVTVNSKITPAFGLPAPPAETTKQSTSSTLQEPKTATLFGAFGQTNSTAGTIDFGKNSTNATPTFAFGSAASSNASNQAQPPAFGSIQATTQKPPTTSQPTSLFGNAASNVQKQSNPTVATTFSSNPATNTTSTMGSGSFAFGASNSSTATPKTTQPELPSAPSFGGKPTNTTTNIFGSLAPQQQQQQLSSSSTSIFGTPAAAATNMFGQASTVEPVKNSATEKTASTPNIFGASSASKPSSTFNFSATNPTTNNIFGSQTSAAGNSFAFGGSSQKLDASGPTKSFTFSGSNTETKPVMFGATKSVPPTFGSANAADSTKPIGFPATSQTNSTNLFTNTAAKEVSKVFSFGAPNNPSSTNAAAPTFGGTGSTFGTSFGSGAPAFGGTKAIPSFTGGTTPAAVSTSSPFGTTNSTPTFGSANTTPTFGNPTPSFASANATPVFGSSNSTPSFTAANAASPFGSTPAFGGSNATPSFGSANATPSFGAGNSTPSFATANAAPSFGTANAGPAFGGSNAFGATSFTANSGPPSFGSTLNSSNNSVFGGSGGGTPAFTTSTGTGDANRTFNFTGNADPAPSPVPNLFNIGPGNPAPRGRTIRTATRRAYR